MEESQKRLLEVGVAVPQVLLPVPGTDLARFAVVACDQYTSQPEYWERVCAFVGDAPSALHLMLPEVYLEAADAERRERDIRSEMERVLAQGILRPAQPGFVLVRRQTTTGVRRGLVLALDLERYDWHEGATSLVRATERTIEERLPPRVRIRQGAPLEMPHIMVLVDDMANSLLGPLDAAWESLEPLYDFDLMEGAGRLSGRLVRDREHLSHAALVLETLRDAGGGLLFAMGDGNHSLATAKACWEQLKPTLSDTGRQRHPARFALVEVVNLHDPALAFEPIHRVLFGAEEETLIRDLGFSCSNQPPLQQLQPLLDDWLSMHPGVSIDYVHGAQEAEALGARPGCVALIQPPFDKNSLFPLVRAGGVLVRKSFSMGEAADKRFYLECRAIGQPDNI